MISLTILCLLLALLYYFPLQLLVAGIAAAGLLRSLHFFFSRWIDDGLFKKPPRRVDCLICEYRLPSLDVGSKYYACCGKIMCNGCIFVNARIDSVAKCPFCRALVTSSDEEIIKRVKKRVEMGDVEAIYNLGCHYSNGRYGLQQDSAKAVELYLRAGELGSAAAYNNIAVCYSNGRGVERDEKKVLHYYELAAMGGDVCARYNLGIIEEEAGNNDRALKHFMIAVEYGCDKSLVHIKQFFMTGYATKDDYEKALRSYQAYLVEIKSDDRDKAAAFSEDFKYYEL